ncbi:MAG TPA: iron-binding protein [Papillibacter sp.]|nr:iron-binding protein [Papillibacter sp.]
MDSIKIKILKNGPYLVTGGVPLREKRIVVDGDIYRYEEGRPLPQSETYTLCRCGKSKNAPFCDGAHTACGFDGTERADKTPYAERAERLSGPRLDLLDDHRCAYARFCHRHGKDAWELVEQSDDAENYREAIIASDECPAGRLTAILKDGTLHEPEYEPAIEVLQDEELGLSCGLFVKGGIPIESADGTLYEVRNRVVLCRCGESANMPFCDASHVDIKFKDEMPGFKD